MSILRLTDDEKKRILEKHKSATKSHQDQKDELKKGLQAPDKKK
jgi:hypothetical protein